MARLGRGRTMVAVAALTALLVANTVRAEVAEAEDDHRFASDFGVGVGAIFTNLFYMPTKFVYSTLGGVTGGLAYVLTGLNLDVANRIWVPSMGGTYVVTPAMLRGEEVLYFSGTTQPKGSTREEEDLPSDKNGTPGKSY